MAAGPQHGFGVHYVDIEIWEHIDKYPERHDANGVVETIQNDLRVLAVKQAERLRWGGSKSLNEDSTVLCFTF